MIIVRLWGGLGNQLFQYAYGYSLARKNNTELLLDCRFYTDEYLSKNPRFTKQKPHIFQCPILCTSTQIPDELNKTISLYQNKYINRLIRIPRKISLPLRSGYKYIKETRPWFDPSFEMDRGKQVYYDGYWQCERYFADFRDELVEQFTLKRDGVEYSKLLEEISSCNSIAVHVRRGDYVTEKKNPGNLNPLPCDYYLKALAKAKETVKNARFFFFSNDIEWVKDNIEFEGDCVYASGMNGIDTLDEFSLMSKCKHMIIANSTFSWWAAWLNQNPEKIIWTPDSWFGNKDILPDEWNKVSY